MPATHTARIAPIRVSTEPSRHEALLREHLGSDPLAEARTLIDMVHRRAEISPTREAFRFEDRACTFAELSADVERAARHLRESGVGAGDKVVLVLANSSEFLPVFYGVQQLRAAAAPVFHGSGPERIAEIARHCAAKAIITDVALDDDARRDLEAALGDHAPILLDARGVLAGPIAPTVADRRALPTPQPNDLAMLQYTSGTTGASKGVMLTHRALLANIRQMIVPASFTEDDVFVSWLPVYHDMGLIIMTMCPIYAGARLVLLPVAMRPRTWLAAITEHRGTFTAAPDFAYRYATKFTGKPEQYDLSSLRFTLVAAEPVRASTIEAFERKFGIRDVLRPAYGLAEACVAVCNWPVGAQGLRVDDDGNVAVGLPIADLEVSIRDGDRELGPGEHGEVCFRSPSQTLGYYRDPDRTLACTTDDGFIRTGDVGYLDADGHLTIVGRIKDLIIVAGRNLAPKEIETIAERCERVTGAMAVGIDQGKLAGEQIHLFVEARGRSDKWAGIAEAVSEAVHAQLGLRPDRVHVVARGTIPRTYNGKLQYDVMRRRYLSGSVAGSSGDDAS